VTIRSEAGGQKMCVVGDDTSMEEFFALASKKLGITAKRVFMLSGVEVDEMDVIRNDDVLMVTEGGEPESKAKGRHKVKVVPDQYKLAVIGSGGVGKSAITLQYVQGRFIVVYDPTIEDAYRKQTVIDSGPCHLDILDTAGQEDYVALRGQWMQERQGFLLVYSVTDKRTFENLSDFYNQLLQIHDICPPVVIMGNKVDVDPSEVQVSKSEGEQLCKSFGAAGFFESSAKSSLNIEESFACVVREIRKRSNPGGKTRRSLCAIL